MIDRLKVSKEEEQKLNLRSDEVKEIMGHIPGRIIRYGIAVVAVVIIGIFAFSFVFKYPDIITGSFYIQSVNPPAFMLSTSNGKLEALLVHDKDTVKQGELLAMVENSTHLSSYHILKSMIGDSLSVDVDAKLNHLPSINNLGSLQASYGLWLKATNDYNNFKSLNYHQQKIKLLNKKVEETQNQIRLNKKQLLDSRESYLITKREFKRDSLLFMSKTIAMAEYQKSKKTLVAQKMSYTNAELNLSNSQMSLAELEAQILELRLTKTMGEEALKLSLIQSIEQLKGDMAVWEKQYCLISPIKGRVSFSGVWEENQNVITGQHVMTILPFEKSDLIGKVIIPVTRAGKVKLHQKVNLKFADFPYSEYGMVNASLDAISEVPDSAYMGTIYLNDTLVSNYGKLLPFKQNMQGVAEIITEDLSLAERLIYPLRAMFNEHIE